MLGARPSGRELANIYPHARYYDSQLGMFLSPDPAEADFNTYRYAEDDPANASDPDGLECKVTDTMYNTEGKAIWHDETKTPCSQSSYAQQKMNSGSTTNGTTGGSANTNRQSGGRRENRKTCDACHGDDEKTPDADTTVVEDVLEAGKEVLKALACGEVPGCGEKADYDVLASKDASWLARVAAAVSLGMNALSDGALPNLGTFAKKPVAGVITGYSDHAIVQAMGETGTVSPQLRYLTPFGTLSR